MVMMMMMYLSACFLESLSPCVAHHSGFSRPSWNGGYKRIPGNSGSDSTESQTSQNSHSGIDRGMEENAVADFLAQQNTNLAPVSGMGLKSGKSTYPLPAFPFDESVFQGMPPYGELHGLGAQVSLSFFSFFMCV